ncbi:MAG: hypothetical protein EXS46_00260 [Candidatus Taylorbacteria bacterium]|nr:hypothetical protein [Candidatus Taylorbacteria bacterium]
MNSLISTAFTFAILILIMTYGISYIVGGPKKANAITKWELKQFLKFGKLTLKLALKAISGVCHWVHRKL